MSVDVKLSAPKGTKMKVRLRHFERLEIECHESEMSAALEFIRSNGFRLTYANPKINPAGRITTGYQINAERAL